MLSIWVQGGSEMRVVCTKVQRADAHDGSAQGRVKTVELVELVAW